MTQTPSTPTQLHNAGKELTVWLAPVVVVWIVAVVALTMFATPWTTTPNSLTIGFGFVIGTAFALYYARRRLNNLTKVEQ